MRVLLVKTSSMGDLIHTLPALTDAGNAIPGIQFDWVVENSFAEIPTWHPLVHKVIPIQLRHWRKNIFASDTRIAFKNLRQELAKENYDQVLDAQGLMKSALLTFFTKGEKVGLDFKSARESMASFAYQRKCHVNFYQHAIIRMRSLFSQALGYPLPESAANFGLEKKYFQQNELQPPYVVFLHGTTWTTKQWPEEYWQLLAKQLTEAGLSVKLSGGNEEEVARAYRIAHMSPAIEVLPYLKITQMAQLLAQAKAAVAVDTGFGHLAAALSVPTISIYGATNPEFTGAIGSLSKHLVANFSCAPCLKRKCTYQKISHVTPACYSSVTPEMVYKEILKYKTNT